ncbi:F-box protein At3g56470-like [Tasmannia lanceolata]|uniref:F-box protein At3g56470-like n=1 Tax=Tasmannia lanceolata TaxID=3420 RepID=UPI0040631BD2
MGLKNSKSSRVRRSTKMCNSVYGNGEDKMELPKECKAKECNSVEGERVEGNGEEGVQEPQIKWTDLPTEIAALIAGRSHLIEFHAFRSVCKQWQLASSLNSSSNPQPFDPWILFYDQSDCFIYDPTSDKSYLMQIPELKGTDCIASEQGWLLVHLDGRLFFFNIFSRAKIDLPEIPCFNLSDHVATFSEPPTSKDCRVFVVVNCMTTNTIEIRMCRHGSRDWEMHTYSPHPQFKTVTCVKYKANDELLCCFDSNTMVMTYNPFTKIRKAYKFVTEAEATPAATRMNVSLKGDYLAPLIKDNGEIRKWLGRFGGEMDIRISLCGMNGSGQGQTGAICFPHEDLGYINGRGDSVNDGKQKYQLKAVLVEPRFIDLTQNHSWFV